MGKEGKLGQMARAVSFYLLAHLRRQKNKHKLRQVFIYCCNKQATPSLVTKIVTVYHAPRFFWSEWNSERHRGNSSSIDRDRQGDTKVGSDLSLEAGSVWGSTNSQLVWVYCHCPVA